MWFESFIPLSALHVAYTWVVVYFLLYTTSSGIYLIHVPWLHVVKERDGKNETELLIVANYFHLKQFSCN